MNSPIVWKAQSEGPDRLSKYNKGTSDKLSALDATGNANGKIEASELMTMGFSARQAQYLVKITEGKIGSIEYLPSAVGWDERLSGSGLLKELAKLDGYGTLGWGKYDGYIHAYSLDLLDEDISTYEKQQGMTFSSELPTDPYENRIKDVLSTSIEPRDIEFKKDGKNPIDSAREFVGILKQHGTGNTVGTLDRDKLRLLGLNDKGINFIVEKYPMLEDQSTEDYFKDLILKFDLADGNQDGLIKKETIETLNKGKLPASTEDSSDATTNDDDDSSTDTDTTDNTTTDSDKSKGKGLLGGLVTLQDIALAAIITGTYMALSKPKQQAAAPIPMQMPMNFANLGGSPMQFNPFAGGMPMQFNQFGVMG